MQPLKIFLDDIVENKRRNEFAESNQLSLGEMILKLEPIVKEVDQNTKVYYDFEYLYPTTINSWRGIYRELALNFTGMKRKDPDPKTVVEFLNMLRQTINKSFDGYKGGSFKMTKQTPVWVASWGNAGRTAVTDIISLDWKIIIETQYISQ